MRTLTHGQKVTIEVDDKGFSPIFEVCTVRGFAKEYGLGEKALLAEEAKHGHSIAWAVCPPNPQEIDKLERFASAVMLYYNEVVIIEGDYFEVKCEGLCFFQSLKFKPLSYEDYDPSVNYG